jgi:hypothetical protein
VVMPEVCAMTDFGSGVDFHTLTEAM